MEREKQETEQGREKSKVINGDNEEMEIYFLILKRK